MTEANRARRLGDVGANAPARWEWGGADGRAPSAGDVLCRSPAARLASSQRARRRAWHDAFDELRVGSTRPTSTASSRSASPTASASRGSTGRRSATRRRADVDYSNVVALGEFLLGYRNEYGKYTDRPLVDADAASAGCPRARTRPSKKDVGRNGTYLVMRQLGQDVRGFWQFVVRQAGGRSTRRRGAGRRGSSAARGGGRCAARRTCARSRRRTNQFTFDDDPRGVALSASARTSAARIRATPTTPDHPTGLTKLLARWAADQGPSGTI